MAQNFISTFKKNKFSKFLLIAIILIMTFQICLTQDILTPEQLRPYMFTQQITGELQKFIPQTVKKNQITVFDFFVAKKTTRPINGTIDQYTINMEQIQQQILPLQFPTTTVYAYGGETVNGYKASYPGPQIIGQYKIPTKITWVNKIVGKHILPYDASYPFPNSTSHTQEVPTVPHVHGMATINGSDGLPAAYWTNTGQKGQRYFTAQPCNINEAVYTYPNQQGAQILWYHDHAMGMTRLNAYAGLAGLYSVQKNDNSLGKSVEQINVEQSYGTKIQVKKLVISDKTFYKNGSLYYPNTSPHPKFTSWVPQFYGNTIVINGVVWPKMTVQPQKYRFVMLNACGSRFINFFFLNTATNTRIPFDLIRQGQYLINPDQLTEYNIAISSRIQIIVDFSALPNDAVILLKNDAPAPYPIGDPANLVDQFTGTLMKFIINANPLATANTFNTVTTLSTLTLVSPIIQTVAITTNTVNKYPVPMRPRLSLYPLVQKAKVQNTKMSIVIKPSLTYPVFPAGTPVYTTLVQQSDADGVIGALIDGMSFQTSFNCTPGNTFKTGQIYDFYIINLTPDSHPMHFHLVNFQKIKEIKFDPAAYEQAWWNANGGPPPRTGYPTHPTMIDPSPYYLPDIPQKQPLPSDKSFRDVLNVHPGYVTIIRVKFSLNNGMGYSFSTAKRSYIYHCHILQHEDNDMMKNYCLV